MLPFLHILVHVEEDGSLHALGAFTTKEKLNAYQKARDLDANQVRLDFHNGPFASDVKVIYAGHRRWHMDQFQLAGYFKGEGEAWNSVTEEGYVSVLRIDVTYEEELRLEQEALDLYQKLQKQWRLTSYKELISKDGDKKTRANITLRFYQDALESFKPRTRRDFRALYALGVILLALPFAFSYSKSRQPGYGQNLRTVDWLPDFAKNVSYYKSRDIDVYEFKASPDQFRDWIASLGMKLTQIDQPQVLSRYTAYIPTTKDPFAVDEKTGQPKEVDIEDIEAWQKQISITVDIGFLSKGLEGEIIIYDPKTGKAYFEKLSRR